MRRNLIPLAAALAVIAVLPATGLAGQLEQAAKGTTPAGLVNRVQRLANALNGFKGRLGGIRRDVNRLKTQVTKLNATDVTQSAAIATLQNTVASQGKDIATLKTDDATTQGAITSINGQLSAGAAALVAINNALTNGTTGLVGLNKARPQFGAFQANGTIIGGTGQVSGASGPSGNAVGTHAIPGLYVIDFGNDVSSRFYSINPFPGGAGAGVPQATDCATTGVAATCAAAEGSGTPDSSPNHVLVEFGGGGTNPANGFEVAALSG